MLRGACGALHQFGALASPLSYERVRPGAAQPRRATLWVLGRGCSSPAVRIILRAARAHVIDRSGAVDLRVSTAIFDGFSTCGGRPPRYDRLARQPHREHELVRESSPKHIALIIDLMFTGLFLS